MEKMTFKEAREKAGISTSAMMAKLLGMSVQSYGQKENYDRHFKDYELVDFCEITGVKFKDLIIRRI